jgi:hypothetical protein
MYPSVELVYSKGSPSIEPLIIVSLIFLMPGNHVVVKWTDLREQGLSGYIVIGGIILGNRGVSNCSITTVLGEVIALGEYHETI